MADNGFEWCEDCNQPQDEEGRRRERRRRRRRGRSEPAECAECATTITTSAATTATSSRSASTGRDQNVRRRSRSNNNSEGVTSIPDPSHNFERRSTSGSSCAHPNNNSNNNQQQQQQQQQSGSRNRGHRRRRSGAGRRRSGSSGGGRRMAGSDLVNPTNNGSGSGSNPSGSVAVTVPTPAEPEDLTRLGPQDEAQRAQIRQWPHSLSFLFACLSCTISMFSISRFAILTIDYGAIFLIQFLILSLLFGIPLLTFFASAGQYLGSGIIDMWRISPIFQGIGVSLMLAQGIYGLYNIAIVSWLFIYFRDSFITSFDRYRWSLCFDGVKYGRVCDNDYSNVNGTFNPTGGWKLEETIPDYFSGIVLMRSAPTYPHSFTALRFQTLFNIVVIWMAVFIALSKGLRSYGKVVYVFGTFPILGFLIFSIKIIGLLPMATFKYWFLNTQWLEFVYNGQSWICAARECFFTWAILGASILQLSSHNSFKHRLLRDTTAIVVVTLVILLLSGIVGVAIVLLIRSSGYDYAVSSFETAESYEFLRRRTTTSRLMRGGREYGPLPNFVDQGNDEKEDGTVFRGAISNSNNNESPFPIEDILASLEKDLQTNGEDRDSNPSSYAKSTDSATKLSGYKRTRTSPRISSSATNSGRGNRLGSPRHDREHVSFLAGIRILQNGRNTDKYSGYQVMRLATELMPSYAAILGPRILSPFWVVLFYLTMIVMGLAQQMALFHTVASGLIAIRPDHFMQFESSLTFMSCLLGLVLCFPMATEFGEFIVYFFDYTIGCGWWLMLLYALLMFAVLVVRGRPYSGENIARILIKPESLGPETEENGRKVCCCCSSCIVPLLAFSWTVLLPVGLVILCIVSFKTCYFAEMFDWTTHTGYLYLPSWVREIGAMLQLLPILLVPFVAIIQTCRYFLNGSDELYEKINLLYRPSYAGQVRYQRTSRSGRTNPSGRGGRSLGVVLTNYNPRATNSDRANNDPPPKYTPPPSYSTATGARIARFLRQSIRQSVRRFRGETSRQDSIGEEENSFSLQTRTRQLSSSNQGKVDDMPPPPDYATVIIETTRHSNPPGSEGSTYGSFSHPTSVSTNMASSSSVISSSEISEINPIETRSSRSSRSSRTTKLEQDERSLRHQLSPDRLLKAAAETLSACQIFEEENSSSDQPDDDPPPSWDFRFSTDQRNLNRASKFRETNPDDDSALFSACGNHDDNYFSVGQVTVRMDHGSAVESEKPKSSYEAPQLSNLSTNVDQQRRISARYLEESSTDPIYSDGSTISFGETLILSDGLNNLDVDLVHALNNPDDRLRRLEPRNLIFNIPPVTSLNDHPVTSSIDNDEEPPPAYEDNGIVTLQIDTSTSVI